ncbi:hypothetical protein K504DRAFT_450060 [Pleomassaria siparia CBS 279.74]|uniref:Uncharacterized protein n=1 Tax=Pleomassaria siparia CBS 279.74 TaxID=1314801 RepID=A0A6G1KKM6_9PLEO|nr:hypothetical protein K504DRAFT_450060 [Pleomassaria siparia CBS 279.74]
MPYHIPFPTAFLSLNTPTTAKKDGSGAIISSTEGDATHTFLSNRSTVPRHSSISSESSTASIPSVTASPTAPMVESPVLKASVPAFLTLNSKHTAPTAPKGVNDNAGFLSNHA